VKSVAPRSAFTTSDCYILYSAFCLLSDLHKIQLRRSENITTLNCSTPELLPTPSHLRTQATDSRFHSNFPSSYTSSSDRIRQINPGSADSPGRRISRQQTDYHFAAAPLAGAAARSPRGLGKKCKSRPGSRIPDSARQCFRRKYTNPVCYRGRSVATDGW
jgi:hypothetical protein